MNIAHGQADGVDGVIHSATRLALQLFLNSERAGQIDKARAVKDGVLRDVMGNLDGNLMNIS